MVALSLGGLMAPASAAAAPAAGSAARDVPVVAAPPPPCPGPASCVVDLDVPHAADVVVPGGARPGNRVRVVLPPGYDPIGGVEHPALLLLHGAGDGSETWVENTDVEELVAELCLDDDRACAVVVMPDAGGKHSESGWYTDWHDGSRHWETFHIDHVVPWIKAHLAVAPCGERWAVAGLSMGGFGALAYAARHPDLFEAVASFSGFLDTKPGAPLSAPLFDLASQNGFGAPTEAMFGPQGTVLDDDGWSAHNPTDRARAGDYRTFEGKVWVATGTGTPGGPAGDELDNPASYTLESVLFELHQHFRLAMAASGTTYRDQSYLGGNHGWPYWQMALRRALPEMLDVLPLSCSTGAGTPPDRPAVPEHPPVAGTVPSPAPGGAASLPATGAGGSLWPATLLALVSLLSLRLVAPRLSEGPRPRRPGRRGRPAP